MSYRWSNLIEPTAAELGSTFRKLVHDVLAHDARVSRREDQVRELLHVLLLKLESDNFAKAEQDSFVLFKPYGSVAQTANFIRQHYADYYARHKHVIFHPSDREEILLTDESIAGIVSAIWKTRVLGDRADILLRAFHVLRTSMLKCEDGQYVTPARIIRPLVMALEIGLEDKVIDPACGTGGFLIETIRQIGDNGVPELEDLTRWCGENLVGIDKDDMGIKLSRAEMMTMGYNEMNVHLGDSIRINEWKKHHTQLETLLVDDGELREQFSVVVSNPPFGGSLLVKRKDYKAGLYSMPTAAGLDEEIEDIGLELGLLYIELAYRLTKLNGRIGLILPETYFFSKKYSWLAKWMEGRLALRGILNIPMEAFGEFCRAKTNFYIFQKVGYVES